MKFVLCTVLFETLILAVTTATTTKASSCSTCGDALKSLSNETRTNKINEIIRKNYVKILASNLSLDSLSNGILRNLAIGKVSASNLNLTELDPKIFKDVFSIKSFGLEKNKINKIDFSRLPLKATKNLTSIFLAHNRFVSVPHFDESRFPALDTIDLSFNKIETLTALYSYFLSLKRLDLSHNLIRSIEFDKFSLPMRGGLLRIDLRSNKIRRVGKLGSFPKLGYFFMAKNYLTQLEPDMFVGAPKLENIDLSQNFLFSLPVDVFKYNGLLYELNLAYNRLSDFRNREFESLTQLNRLLLNHNKLKRVSLELFGKLVNLETLDLSYNRLEVIETTDSSIQLNNLKTLELTSNKLKLFDESIRYFPRLEYLFLADNHLYRLPSNITNFRSLDVSNQNKKLLILDDFALERSRSSMWTTLLKLDLADNEQLVFSPKSLCIRDDYSTTSNCINRQIVYKDLLDLTLSETALANISRCTLINLARFFRRVRVFVAGVARDKHHHNKKSWKQARFVERNNTTANEICKCEFRLFLSSFNILIKDTCPRYKTHCAGRTSYPINDCPNNPCAP